MMSQRWKPKEGEKYWVIAFTDVMQSVWRNDIADDSRWQSGNCFETKAAAKAAADKVKDLLLNLHDNDESLQDGIQDMVTKTCQALDQGRETVAKATCTFGSLPKLTVDVFNLSDCPEWAMWAAVNRSGYAYYYSDAPVCKSGYWVYDYNQTGSKYQRYITGHFDASDWKHSLVIRPSKALPKLTTEVFNHPGCPEWAKWAAVDGDGTVVLFDRQPVIASIGLWWFRCGKYRPLGEGYDSSDWKNSLIERPAKETKLPDWCKVGEWVYDGIREKYRKIIRIDMTIKGCSPVIFFNEDTDLLCPSMQLNSIGGMSLKPARLRPYNEGEMKALVGHAVDSIYGAVYLVTAFYPNSVGGEVSIYGLDYNADKLLDEFTINNKPAGVLEHLNEKGEWVK